MEFIIKEFVSKTTEDDIANFAKKNGVTLTNDELNTIYMYMKNYWQVFLKEDSTYLFEELKQKLRPEVYDVIVKLYNKYKKVI